MSREILTRRFERVILVTLIGAVAYQFASANPPKDIGVEEVFCKKLIVTNDRKEITAVIASRDDGGLIMLYSSKSKEPVVTIAAHEDGSFLQLHSASKDEDWAVSMHCEPNWADVGVGLHGDKEPRSLVSMVSSKDGEFPGIMAYNKSGRPFQWPSLVSSKSPQPPQAPSPGSGSP